MEPNGTQYKSLKRKSMVCDTLGAWYSYKETKKYYFVSISADLFCVV